MIRVLHVIDSFDLGGAQTALLEFLRFIDRSRFVCDVASMHGRGVFYGAFKECANEVHVLSPRKWLPAYGPRLFGLLYSGKYDIAHFHLFGSNWIGKPLAALAGTPVRFNHDQCNDAFRSQNRLAVAIDTLTNRFATQVIAVSQSTREFLLTHERLTPSKVKLLPNSVDTEAFIPTDEGQKAEAKRRLGCDPRAVLVLGAGRLHPQKDFGTFLETAARFRNQNDITFILAGSGPDEADLKARNSQLGNPVRMIGFREDTKSLYAAADILLLTSLYEGLPMVLLEAMSSGCSIVGSRVDGIAEVIREGKDGLLAPPGDVTGFFTHIQNLVGDSDCRQSFGRAARRRMRESFDSRLITKRLESMYEDALRGCQRKASSST